MVSIAGQYDEVWYPVFIVNDIPIWPVTCGEGNPVLILVQLFLKIRYLICKGECGRGVLLFPPSNGSGKALGNVEDGNVVVLVELHHSFSKGGGDGACWSCGGLYGGRRAKGCLDHSVDGDIGHFSGFIRVVIRAGIVLAEPSVNESVVGGLVVNP
jgi:hypothetical protein